MAGAGGVGSPTREISAPGGVQRWLGEDESDASCGCGCACLEG